MLMVVMVVMVMVVVMVMKMMVVMRVAMLLIDRSIDVEESHYVGHMRIEYEIGRPTTWQNPRRHQHLRHKLPTLRPLQSRYKKRLAFNVVEL